MKKFISLFLVFCLVIPQTFSAIDFSSPTIKNKIQGADSGLTSSKKPLFEMAIPGKIISKYPESVSILIVGVVGSLVFAQSYLKRSRDINRMSALRNLALAMSSYYIDTAQYPAELSNGCVPYDELIPNYIQNTLKDPKKGHKNPSCADDSGYAYRVTKDSKGFDIYIISAIMEDSKNANSPYTIDQLKKYPHLLKMVMAGKFKGKGKYYIISN